MENSGALRRRMIRFIRMAGTNPASTPRAAIPRQAPSPRPMDCPARYPATRPTQGNRNTTTGVTRVTDYSYIPIYTVKRSESAGDYSYSRVMRIETAMDAYEGNFLDKVTQACYEDMEYSLKRIKERLDMQKWLGTETEPTETTETTQTEAQ